MEPDAICEAEVRRISHRGAPPPYPGAYGARAIHQYAYGRCTRKAVAEVKMYPPRDESNAMHPVQGVVCKQHAEQWLPRKASGLG